MSNSHTIAFNKQILSKPTNDWKLLYVLYAIFIPTTLAVALTILLYIFSK